MQFNVPQFIDVEDKIFGPLTFKQFVYVVGGLGMSVVAWWLLPTIIAIPVIVAIAAFSLALAFWEVNKKPFLHTVRAFSSYITSARLYVWKRQDHESKSAEQLEKETKQLSKIMPEISGKKLDQSAWAVNVEGEPAARNVNPASRQAEGSNQNKQ